MRLTSAPIYDCENKIAITKEFHVKIKESKSQLSDEHEEQMEQKHNQERRQGKQFRILKTSCWKHKNTNNKHLWNYRGPEKRRKKLTKPYRFKSASNNQNNHKSLTLA